MLVHNCWNTDGPFDPEVEVLIREIYKKDSLKRIFAKES